jgi:hypothetical protein
MRPGEVIGDLWILWIVSWVAAMGWSHRTVKRAGLGAQMGYRLVLIAGGVLLFDRAHGYEGPLRLWHVGRIGAWICVAMVAFTSAAAFEGVRGFGWPDGGS